MPTNLRIGQLDEFTLFHACELQWGGGGGGEMLKEL